MANGVSEGEDNMQFDLLGNGIDSLKAAGDILMEPDYNDEFQPYQIKDALFHFSHGVEILSKYILKSDKEIRIYCNYKAYREAFDKQRLYKFNSIFEADPTLKIIGVTTALSKLKNDQKYPLGDDLWNSLDEIRLFRNAMMHYTITLDEEEFYFFANDFRLTFAKTFYYFNEHIPAFKGKVDTILRNEGLVDYQEYIKRIDNLRLEIQRENCFDAQADMMDTLERSHR